MANPNFTVDRRPVVHISYGVAGGIADQYWGSTADHCKAVIDPTNNLRRAGVSETTNIGVQQVINTMSYHYDRGIRRFIINSPCGTITSDGSTGGELAFAGVWSTSVNKWILRKDGTRVINPFEGCWPDGVPSDPYASGVNDGSIQFVSNGRTLDWYVLLRSWIAGDNDLWPGASAKQDIEIAIYSSFVIPLSNFAPTTNKNWVDFPNDANNKTLMNASEGYAFPDPANNYLHAAYLRNEYRRWFECGICGVGADVGQYAWNHSKGSWIYQDTSDLPTGYANPKTDMRKWWEDEYFGLTQGTETDQRFSESTKFTYFQEALPWNPTRITNKTTSNEYPTAGTEEAYALLDHWGATAKDDLTEYAPGWAHYSPSLIAVRTLTSWQQGDWANDPEYYNGVDPNGMWQFDPETTEVHVLASVPLCAPYANAVNGTMNTLSNSLGSSETQTIIENCVDFWMDFMNRGYVYQPILYHNDYAINRTIHKRIMQELELWPESDPAI